MSAGHEIRYGKQLAQGLAYDRRVSNASNYDYCCQWSFLPFQNSPQWSRISMILCSGVFPPPLCWLPPRLLPGVPACCLPLQW